MVITLPGIEIFSKLTQFTNVPSSIFVNPSGSTMLLRLTQFGKALWPMVITLPGIEIFSNLAQYANVQFSISVNPSGINNSYILRNMVDIACSSRVCNQCFAVLAK